MQVGESTLRGCWEGHEQVVRWRTSRDTSLSPCEPSRGKSSGMLYKSKGAGDSSGGGRPGLTGRVSTSHITLRFLITNKL